MQSNSIESMEYGGSRAANRSTIGSPGSVRVVELCLSPDKGGLELYVARVIRLLDRSQLLCLPIVVADGELERMLKKRGLPFRRLSVFFRWFPVVAARRLARWIDAEQVDVIHMHWAKDLNLAVLARRLAKRPVRLVYSRQMAITRPKRDWYHRALYRQVDLLLVITRRLQEEARQFLPLPPSRIQVLYHGVPAPRPCSDCAALRRDLGIPEGRFLVGLFGRIEPAKGQQILIEAMELLRQRGCDVYAALFGHPVEPRHLDNLLAHISRLNLGDRIVYAAFREDPQDIMNCFDCVVLTTYNETFGLVLIEAMRAGTAVIGTNAGGVPEIIEHEKTGLLVPPGDAAALADAIERLARDRGLRDRLAVAGKRSADERFDEDQHFARLTELLKEIAR